MCERIVSQASHHYFYYRFFDLSIFNNKIFLYLLYENQRNVVRLIEIRSGKNPLGRLRHIASKLKTKWIALYLAKNSTSKLFWVYNGNNYFQTNNIFFGQSCKSKILRCENHEIELRLMCWAAQTQSSRMSQKPSRGYRDTLLRFYNVNCIHTVQLRIVFEINQSLDYYDPYIYHWI